jgi:anti-sigma factor RsiW
MGETKPLSPSDREDLIAYLDNEADPQATERVQNLLEQNPAARQEKELLEESWRLLDILERPGAGPNFKERTTSLAATAAYSDEPQPRGWGFQVWLGVVALGFAGGWLGVALAPDRHRETLKLLPVLERYDSLRAGKSIEFLREVQKERLLPPISEKSSGGKR